MPLIAVFAAATGNAYIDRYVILIAGMTPISDEKPSRRNSVPLQISWYSE